MPDMKFLTLRGATGMSRRETLDGRAYTVVPAIALVEGVIHPVNAPHPELVRAERFAGAVAKWERQPIFAGHPMENGVPVSGKLPGVLPKSFGFTRNASAADKQLRMEVWIDEAKAAQDAHSAEILRRSQAHEPCEVSVGVFVHASKAEGTWSNGRRYAGEWMSMEPDHLALFGDGRRGACSIDMGCGTCRAAEENVMRVAEDGSLELLGSPDQPRDEKGRWTDSHTEAAEHEKIGGGVKYHYEDNPNGGLKTVKYELTPPPPSSPSLRKSVNEAIAPGSWKDSLKKFPEGEGDAAKEHYNKIRGYLSSQGFKAVETRKYSGGHTTSFLHEATGTKVNVENAYLGTIPGDRAKGLRGTHKVRVRREAGGFRSNEGVDDNNEEGGMFGRFMEMFRAAMPRGWSKNEVDSALRDALAKVEPGAFDVVDWTDSRVVYCVWANAGQYAAPSAPEYYARTYTRGDNDEFTLSDREEVEPTMTYPRAAQFNPDQPRDENGRWTQASEDALATAKFRVKEETGAVEKTAQWPDSADHKFARSELKHQQGLVQRLEAKKSIAMAFQAEKSVKGAKDRDEKRDAHWKAHEAFQKAGEALEAQGKEDEAQDFYGRAEKHREKIRTLESPEFVGQPKPPCGCGGHEPVNAAPAAGDKDMEKKERIAALVANPHSPVKSLKMLEAATDDELTALEAQAGTIKAAAEKAVADAATLKAAQDAEAKAKADLKAAQEAPITIDRLPADLKALVDGAVAAATAKKEGLVATLKAAQTAFTEDDLKAMPVEQLEKLSAAVVKPAPAVNAPLFSGIPVPRISGDANQYAPPDTYADLKRAN